MKAGRQDVIRMVQPHDIVARKCISDVAEMKISECQTRGRSVLLYQMSHALPSQ